MTARRHTGHWPPLASVPFLFLMVLATVAVTQADVDITKPQVDPGCADGCPPLEAEAGQPTTFTFGYSDDVGVTGCTLYVDSVAQGPMTLTAPGGTTGFASRAHTFTTLGAHTVGATCQDAAGNEGGGPVARDVQVVDTTAPQVDPRCADGCPPLEAEAGQSTTFTFGYSDNVGVTGCILYVDSASRGSMTLSPLGGRAGTASKDHTFTILGAHTVGATCQDGSGNEGGGTVALDVNVTDTTPPDTTIASAVDGNGNTIVDGEATLSKAITFSFTGSDVVGVSGFSCSLNGASFSSCTSPGTYSSLSTGSHTFQVRAIDTSGNTDPVPATFTWTVLTPAQAIQKLIDKVKALQLQKGIGTSLDAILSAAQQALQNVNQNDDAAALNSLKAFINAVEAQRGKHLTDGQVNELVSAAQAIIGSLPGP